MHLTIKKIEFMHGECDETLCPICKDSTNDPKQNINEWIHMKLSVVRTGYPNSYWWDVEETNGDCYRTLRGNLRYPGYYDTHPEAH
jgi:hypothetical protein